MGYQKATSSKTATATLSRKPVPVATPLVAYSRSLHPILRLQHQVGNRAVTQMLQAKMTVGKPNDTYEHEADRVADNVMRMPDPLVQRQAEEEEPAQTKLIQRQTEEEPAQAKPLAGIITPLIQRQSEEEEPAQAKSLQRQAEEEEPAQAKSLQRQAEEEEPAQAKLLQRQAEEEEPAQAKSLQRQAEEEEPAQAKPLQRQTEDETAQAKGATATTVSPGVESSIQAMRGGGRPLPDETRGFYETRMGYDLSGVRIHADANANDAATHLNAQAFTLGQDIFFGAGRYEPQTNSGKWLLAHELTHTVQQSPQPMRVAAKVSHTHMTKATPSASGAQRRPLSVTAAPAQAQRLFGIELPGIDTVRNWAADRAANIPGFTMLTVILGRNPINDRPVQRNATNLIRGALGFIPGGDLIFRGLQASGALERVGAWLREQIAQLNITWEGIVGLFSQALRSLGVRDLANISGAGERILNIFRPTIGRIRAFASSVSSRVLQFIKEAILRPVGQFAQRLPFYPLLTVILGKDPITDQEVPRNATNVIRGILVMLPGGEEKFQNLQRSGIIDRAFNWFNEQLNRLNLTWNYIKSLFIRLWESLSINDLLSPSAAFERIRGIFGEPVQRITTFAGAAIRKVAEFIFEGVLTLAGGLGQQVLRVFNRARGVFSSIIENPIGFVGNLVNAVKRGFQQFSGNILTHLRAGLIGWLLGALAGSGLQLPERFDLQGIVSLVMQVLGLTYQRLRGILVRLLGSEERVQRAEQVFDFLVTLVRDGIGAAWERIVEFAGNLQEMVIGGIRDWVARTVVGQAIARLVTLFNPAGAIIQAIMAIYNTVVFFIERAQQIGALVEAVFESIANIAGGNVGVAASYVERTMARSIPVMLGFLARFIGLGNVGEQIQTVIRRVQAPITNAMERVAGWIVSRVRGLLGRAGGADPSTTQPDNRTSTQKESDLREAVRHATEAANQPDATPDAVRTQLMNLKDQYRVTALELRPTQEGTYQVYGAVNPVITAPTPLSSAISPQKQAQLLQMVGNDRARLQRFLTLVNNDVHQLERLLRLIDCSTRLERLFGVVTVISSLEAYLEKVGGRDQAPRLEALLSFATRNGRAVTDVESILNLCAGDGTKMERLTEAAPKFLKNSVTGSPQPPNLRGYVYANVPHFLKRHTYEFFDFSDIKASQGIWPARTTVDRLARSYLQEAINDHSATAVDPTTGNRGPLSPNTAVPVIVASGSILAQFGVRLPQAGEPTPGIVIGQFYPADGPGVITFSKVEMQAISNVLRL